VSQPMGVPNTTERGSPAAAVSPGEAGDLAWMERLSGEQRTVIEAETWHHVVAYWFVGGSNVRLAFDNGESYTLYVDGEMDDFDYQDAGGSDDSH